MAGPGTTDTMTNMTQVLTFRGHSPPNAQLTAITLLQNKNGYTCKVAQEQESRSFAYMKNSQEVVFQLAHILPAPSPKKKPHKKQEEEVEENEKEKKEKKILGKGHCISWRASLFSYINLDSSLPSTVPETRQAFNEGY